MNENLNDFNLPSKFDYEEGECDAKVIAIFDANFKQINETINNQNNWLVFDKTCMYALSGGEEPDKGYILLKNNKYEVLDVKKAPNGQHLHLINQSGIKLNDNVKVVCDELMKHVISSNHTAEHLIQGALRHILDPNIKQMGVNLTHDTLSVSFAWNTKLDDNQLKQIEDFVNKAIQDSINVEISFKTLDEAVAVGAVAKFSEVYNKVKGLLRIVKIDDIYTVLCAGRHVKNTSELEQFHIIKFTSKGSGVYKIDAISTNYLTNLYIDKYNNEIQQKISILKEKIISNKLNDDNIINQLESINLSNDWNKTILNIAKVDKLVQDLNKALEALKNKQMNDMVNHIVESTTFDLSKQYNLIELNNQPSNILNILGNRLINKYQTIGFIIVNKIDNKVSYLIIKNSNANIKKPNDLIKQINSIVNGRGGGKENQCQGSCPYASDTIENIKWLIKQIDK